MSSSVSDFLTAVKERGFMHQCTDWDALAEKTRKGPKVCYIGFDCTAPSLHAGSLVSIMLLRLWQRAGHKPIVLMGGGTTRVGDPSGKDESRKLLDDDAIAANMAGIKKIFAKYLTFGDGPTDAVMVNNADWLDELAYIPFLRDVGRHFSVNRMLTFENVKTRLGREQPLSFLEFNYMILQAYDFVELAKRYDCRLQMGGSDQWGNIVNGVELSRRMLGKEVHGLTAPLLTTASGAKMGKTADGAVWLNGEMLGSYDFWQYWRNTEDADVGKFLKLFTDLPLDEITDLENSDGAEINEAKKILATEVTALCHGRDAAEAAAETARKTFEERATTNSLPTIEVGADRLAAGVPFAELFREAGLASSNGEARRLARNGGARLNDEKVVDETLTVSSDQVNADGVIKLSAGKKRHVLVRPV